MKVLLDESVPRRLASFFPEPLTLRTVQEKEQVQGVVANGLPLSRASSGSFSTLVPADRSIGRQQNIGTLPIPTIVFSGLSLHDNLLLWRLTGITALILFSTFTARRCSWMNSDTG